jgi:Cu(I)/Ag(I) efflux system membrane fusion protein
MVSQRELLFAFKDYQEKLKSKSPSFQEAKETLISVLRKFDAWGLTKENIDKIIKTGKVSKYMTLYAPTSGIVIQKNALEGKYFKTGDRLFTIANLSEVWVMLEAYETDLPWLRYGQEVEFTTKSCPGEIFKGRIAFIDPTLNPQTRTVTVRVNAPNPAGKLKPEMFVNATVHAQVSQSGKVIDVFLAGKWICPMHPSVIESKPGKCRICGMKLVKAASLGYGPVDEKNRKPLVIPATAPLITGKRAIVYLAAKNKPGTYYGQEIVLGPRAGNYYVVEKGLKEGDQVVVNGNFEIDSALQIQAKPSMMSDEKSSVQNQEKAETNKTVAAVSKHFQNNLDQVYLAYFGIQNALADDDLKNAQKNAEVFKTAVSQISHDKLTHDSMKEWHKLKNSMLNSAKEITVAKNLTEVRQAFSSLSADIYELCKKFGLSGKFPVYRFFCSMAFNNKGGYWLQDKTAVFNPYFGKTMLKCGEKIEDVAK